MGWHDIAWHRGVVVIVTSPCSSYAQVNLGAAIVDVEVCFRWGLVVRMSRSLLQLGYIAGITVQIIPDRVHIPCINDSSSGVCTGIYMTKPLLLANTSFTIYKSAPHSRDTDEPRWSKHYVLQYAHRCEGVKGARKTTTMPLRDGDHRQ